MRTIDYFLMAYTSFCERKGRSIGAIIGIVIAIISLSIALGMVGSFQIWFKSQFEKTFGVNSIYVVADNINDVDIAYIKNIPGVKDVVGIAFTSGVIMSGEPQHVNIVGIDPEKLDIIYSIDKIDEIVEEGSAEIKGLGFIMGGYVWSDPQTGIRKHEYGEKVIIRIYTSSGVREISGIVIGLIKPRQGRYIGLNPDTSILMDIDTYFSLIDTSRSYRLLIVVAEETEYIDSVTNMVRMLIPNARTFNPSYIISQFNMFVGSLQLFTGLISGTSMFIVGLWIFDTMTISVLQRTREIGIMKALGYRKRDILLLFLTETILITIIGICIGISLTMILAPHIKLNAYNVSISPAITPDVIFITLLLPSISNILAAYIPARRASNLDPLGALRHE